MLQDRPEYRTARSYLTRSLSEIAGITLHYSASSYGTGKAAIEGIALYQISDDAIQQTSTGRPFPGIAYSLAVDAVGDVYLCWPLTTRVWHSAASVGGTSRNASHVGIVWLGNHAPTEMQVIGLARAIDWCERQLGRRLSIEGHRDPGYATLCPGPAWPDWRGHLELAIQEERAL